MWGEAFCCAHLALIATVLLLALIFSITGSILYGLADTKYQILGFRFLSGFGAGGQAVVQSYISTTTTVEERTIMMAGLGGALTLSFILGPAIGVGLNYINVTTSTRVQFDGMTSPGYFGALCSVINFLLIAVFFTTLDESEQELSNTKDTDNGEGFSINRGKADDEASSPLLGDSVNGGTLPPLQLVSCFVAVNFLLFNCLAVYETISTPLTMNIYNWGITQNGIMWGVLGVTSAIAYTTMGLLQKRGVGDWMIILVTTAGLVGAFAFMIDWNQHVPMWRYLTGTLFVSICFPVAQTILTSLFSKILGPIQQGRFLVIMKWCLIRLLRATDSLTNKQGHISVALLREAVSLE